MSNLTTLPKGDSAWLFRKALERIIQQISVLETNIGSSTTGNSNNTEIIFNDNGVLRGDKDFAWNKTSNILTVDGAATITGDLTVDTSTLKVDSANNRVGIGTATPTVPLDVVGIGGAIFNRGSANQYRLQIGNSNKRYGLYVDLNANNTDYFAIYDDTAVQQMLTYVPGASGSWTHYINGSTAMTLNSTGLGVGLSATYKIQSVGTVAASDSSVNGSGGNFIGALLNSDVAGSGANPGVDLRRWTGSALNHGTTYIATNSTGDTLFYNGSVASNTRATSLKMTLDASGNLLVGAASFAVNNGKLRIEHSGLAGEWGIQTKSSTTDGYVGVFYTTTGQAGFISVNGTSTTFSTTSDYRLKESVQPLIGGLARINNLKPSTYKWKADGSNSEGFIAHELAEVVPAAVTGQKDAVNADGSIKPQGVDLSKLVPVLVAAIQELAAEVNALKNA